MVQLRLRDESCEWYALKLSGSPREVLCLFRSLAPYVGPTSRSDLSQIVD